MLTINRTLKNCGLSASVLPVLLQGVFRLMDVYMGKVLQVFIPVAPFISGTIFSLYEQGLQVFLPVGFFIDHLQKPTQWV